MYFFIFCNDKPDHQAVRKDNREAHLAYLDKFRDQVVVVGPTLTDDQGGMNGSVLLMDFTDRDAVDAFLAGDPYGQAGLFDSVTVRPWRKVIPED